MPRGRYKITQRCFWVQEVDTPQGTYPAVTSDLWRSMSLFNECIEPLDPWTLLCFYRRELILSPLAINAFLFTLIRMTSYSTLVVMLPFLLGDV